MTMNKIKEAQDLIEHYDSEHWWFDPESLIEDAFKEFVLLTAVVEAAQEYINRAGKPYETAGRRMLRKALAAFDVENNVIELDAKIDYSQIEDLPCRIAPEDQNEFETSFNMREWVREAIEAKGGKFTGGGFGLGGSDLDIEIEGFNYNIKIRPI